LIKNGRGWENSISQPVPLGPGAARAGIAASIRSSAWLRSGLELLCCPDV
jgi:hypothetical protein